MCLDHISSILFGALPNPNDIDILLSDNCISVILFLPIIQLPIICAAPAYSHILLNSLVGHSLSSYQDQIQELALRHLLISILIIRHCDTICDSNFNNFVFQTCIAPL